MFIKMNTPSIFFGKHGRVQTWLRFLKNASLIRLSFSSRSAEGTALWRMCTSNRRSSCINVYGCFESNSYSRSGFGWSIHPCYRDFPMKERAVCCNSYERFIIIHVLTYPPDSFLQKTGTTLLPLQTSVLS
jgi:hypothetical protein